MDRRATAILVVALAALLLVAPATASAYTFSSPTATEGDGLVFDVSGDTPGEQVALLAGTVEFDPQSGSAVEGVDFPDQSGLRASSGRVTVATTDDSLDEPGANETLTLVPSSGSNSGTGQIADGDPPPGLVISDATLPENGGPATLLIGSSHPSAVDIDIPLSGAPGSAAPNDYGVPASVRLPAGQTVVQLQVAIADDTEDEIDETFSVRLEPAPANATVVDGDGQVTITNDDLRIVDVLDISTPEGDGGTSTARFVVRLNAPTFRTVTVNFATADGLARAPADYLARLGLVTFQPGQTTANIDVVVAGDDRKEDPEAFALVLTGTNGNARIGDGAAVGVIIDDDGGTPPGTLPGTTPGTNPSADDIPPRITLGRPRRKGSRVTIRVACPSTEQSCAGRVTLFNSADRRSRARLLRRERRLGTKSFRLAGGRAQTVSIRLSRTILRAARQARRLKVQAFAVTQDAAANVDTSTKTATLRYRR